MIKFITTDKWFMGIAVTGLVIYMAWTGFVVTTDKPLDYYVYVISAHAFGNGENIYSAIGNRYGDIARQLGITNYTSPYQYPILTALVVYPLTFLQFRVGAAIWVGLSGLAALVSGLVLCSFTDVIWKRRAILLTTIGFVPIFTSMHAGQVNLFVLLTTVLALHCLHRGRDLWSGILLSLGLWLKPFAFMLIPLMIWRRKWRVVGGLAVGTFLVNLASLILFGIQPTITQFTRVLHVATPSGLGMSPTIQNVNGLLGRWAMEIPSSIGFFLYLFIAGLLLGITMVTIGLNRTRQGLEVEAVLLIVVTHLIVPLTWYHHLVMLVPVLAFIVLYLDNKFKIGAATTILTIGLILTDMHGLAWRWLSDLHWTLTNFPSLTAVFLWGFTLASLQHFRVDNAQAIHHLQGDSPNARPE